MAYYVLRQNHKSTHFTPRALLGVEPDSLDGRWLVNTEAEGAEVPCARIIVGQEGQEPCDFLEWPCFAVSDRMRRVLGEAGIDNVEFFPAQIEREGSPEIHSGYWVGNIQGLVTCVDRERSHFDPLPEGGDGVLLSFHVDPSATHDLPLFRLAERPSLVMVHERLRRQLEDASLVGLAFQATADYDGRPLSLEQEDSEE